MPSGHRNIISHGFPDYLRLERNSGHKRQEPDDQASHDQHYRCRDARPVQHSHDEQGDRCDAEDDK